MSYKQIQISRFGGPSVLKIVTCNALPEPAPDEARIKVINASANFTDCMIRLGKYPEVREKPPFVPGYDLVGCVDKVGDAVTQFKPGDLVADLTVIGAYSEYVCLPAKRLVKMPATIDPAKASTLILSYVTAYQMLHRQAKVKPGDAILIHGGGGAVGMALIQLAKLLNLEIFATASADKCEFVESMGAKAIDYREEDFVKVIKASKQGSVKAAFDAIGIRNFKKSYACLQGGGKLIAYGFYNAVMGKGGNMPLEFFRLLSWKLIPDGKKLGFYIITNMRRKHPDWFKEDLATLFQLLEEGKIQPHIVRKLPFQKAKEAHELIENASICGKIVLTFGY